MNEAKAYMEDYALRNNLIEIPQTLQEVDSDDVTAVMGWTDDPKRKSSITLFVLGKQECEVFQKALDKFFRGEKDQKTIEILQKNQSGTVW